MKCVYSFSGVASFFIGVNVFVYLSSVSEVRGSRITSDQLNMTFEMGRDATLTCSVRNIGNRRVMWKRLSFPFPISVGTTRFSPGNKYRVKRQGDDWQLVIRNVQHSDAGEYECRLTGKDDVANILSLIIPGAGRTHLVPTETTVTVRVGSSALLPCHVNNLRKYLVLWQDEQGKVISLRKKTHSGDKRHRVIHEDKPQWSLQIRRVQPEDFGRYTCVVNTNPPLTRVVELREGKSSIGHDKVPETGASTSGNPQLMTETFRDEVQVDQYQSVDLTCQFTGDPRPTIRWEQRWWTPDGVKVIEALNATGETYTLTNVQPENAGIYVCRATNGHPPPVQAKIRVLVREVMTTTTPAPTTTTFDPIDDAAPRVYAFEPLVYQRRGRDAELSCRAVGVPRPIVHWRLNGVQIHQDYKHGIASLNRRHHTVVTTLHVRSISSANFGDYQCYAYNRFGEASTTITLARLQL